MEILNDIIAELQSVSSEAWRKKMQHFAIDTDKAIGVSMPLIRDIGKNIIKQRALHERHQLALQLWASEIHEARILASVIDDARQVTKKQMNSWTHDFESWDVCDQVCSNLFRKTDFFIEKAFEYSRSRDEFVKRCGFVLMTQYAVHEKKSSDDICVEFLRRIEEEAWDTRGFVKKAVNWCLRSIGKRNKSLYPKALACANQLLSQSSDSAHWIAKDAIRELQSEAIITRLK